MSDNDSAVRRLDSLDVAALYHPDASIQVAINAGMVPSMLAEDVVTQQRHENDLAKVVITCEPEGASLMMGALHPRASLYERPVNLKQAQTAHAKFRDMLRKQGCKARRARTPGARGSQGSRLRGLRAVPHADGLSRDISHAGVARVAPACLRHSAGLASLLLRDGPQPRAAAAGVQHARPPAPQHTSLRRAASGRIWPRHDASGLTSPSRAGTDGA